MSDETIKVIIADDHQVMAEGLRQLLARKDMEVVGIASNGYKLLELLSNQFADIVLLDIGMPEMNGIEALPLVKKSYPDVKVLILTTHEDGAIINKVLKNGASGYLLKNSSVDYLINSIKKVMNNETVLGMHLTSKLVQYMQGDKRQAHVGNTKITRREKDVLELLIKGKSVSEIADHLYISHHTVISHKKNLFEKFEVHNVVNLVTRVLDANILDNKNMDIQ